MRRRALLSTVGIGLLTGCIADDTPGGTDTTRPTAEPTTDRPTATTTATSHDVGVVPAEAAGPPWGDDVKRVVSWTEVTDETPIALRPATQAASLPTATFDVTLTNETDVRFDTNFYGWRVWKRVDGGWSHVAPQAYPEPLTPLGPGESHTWVVTVDNTQPDDGTTDGMSGKDSVTLSDLDSGTYAFTIDGWFATEDYDRKVGFAARFDLTVAES